MSKLVRREPVAVPSDAQVVFLDKSGWVAGTKGGPAFTVGGAESDFTREDPARVQKLVAGLQAGELTAFTPRELYQGGVDGDRSKLMFFFTSGGEGSSIGANLGTVARELGGSNVILGVEQGFGTGVLPKKEFEKYLLVLNDPRIIERIAKTGGSPLGLSRTKIDADNINVLWGNVEGSGGLYGTGGGDHSRNFKQIREKSVAEGKPLVVGVTPKSIDLDLAINLSDGTRVNSLMLGALSAAQKMRVRWFDEFQSAAGYQTSPGECKGCVGNFFGRGAGWAVFGATRRDNSYWDILKRQGILSDDLYNKMDALSRKQIILVPEFPSTIPEFLEEVKRVYNKGSMKTVGVAASEGFMFREVDAEYRRLAHEVAETRLTSEIISGLRSEGRLHTLIQDGDLSRVFERNPDVAGQFFKEVLHPNYDVWGHPKLGFMPKIINAVVTTLSDCKKTNYAEITYEARTAESTPWDRLLAEKTGRLAASKLQAGESGLTTVTYLDGQDPFLIDVAKAEPSFMPFSDITGMTETDNNLKALPADYLRRCGVFIP